DGSWNEDETDVEFTWVRNGEVVATRTVTVTRTNETLDAALDDETGEATSHTLSGDETSSLTIRAEHTNSGVVVSQTVQATVAGQDGAGGEDGVVKNFIFIRSATQPATPTGHNIPSGWSDTPPAADGNPLWTSVATQELDGTTIGS